MRLNIPTIFVSGGPMEAGELDNRHLDLIDAMIESADTSVSDERIAQVERNACRDAVVVPVCLRPTR